MPSEENNHEIKYLRDELLPALKGAAARWLKGGDHIPRAVRDERLAAVRDLEAGARFCLEADTIPQDAVARGLAALRLLATVGAARPLRYARRDPQVVDAIKRVNLLREHVECVLRADKREARRARRARDAADRKFAACVDAARRLPPPCAPPGTFEALLYHAPADVGDAGLEAALRATPQPAWVHEAARSAYDDVLAAKAQIPDIAPAMVVLAAHRRHLLADPDAPAEAIVARTAAELGLSASDARNAVADFEDFIATDATGASPARGRASLPHCW